jgi:hypothetical protein
LTANLQVGLILNVSATNLAFGVDLSHASVTAVNVAVDFGPPLAPVYQDALQSGGVLAALSGALQSIPQSTLTFTVPGASGTLAYTISGVTAQVVVSNAVVIPLDSVLDVALDVAQVAVVLADHESSGRTKLSWMQFSGRSRSFSGPFFLLLKIVKKIF